MKKVIALFVAIALLATPQAAFAATKTIKLAKFGSASIATSIKLPAKNACIVIPFKYDLSGNYSWPYSFTSFSIENKAQDMVGYANIRPGDEYYDENENELSVPHKGSSSMKVCREDWEDLDEDGDGNEYFGVKKGTYYFSFTVTQIRPFRMDSSKTIAITFK